MVKIQWDTHKWETEFAFRNLQDYFELIEDQYKIVHESEKKKIPSEPPPNYDEEDYYTWQTEINSFEDRYEKDFPSKIRYSFLVLLHIYFETRIRNTCNEITKRNNFEIKEKDFKGSIIDRVKIFSDKISRTPIRDQEIWQWLEDFQKVRDCIVHTNGQVELSRDQKRLKDLVNKNMGLKIDEGFLFVERKYCIKILEVVQVFFDQLFESAGFGPSFPIIKES